MDDNFLKFIRKHHLLTLATVNGEGMPYVANCFYAYDKERNLFIFTSDTTTRHGKEMEENANVALSIQGLQIVGKAQRGDSKAQATYVKRFPYTAVAPLSLWMVAPTMMKLTDNTLGFGKKLIWESEE